MTDIISKERLEKIAFGSVRQSQEEGVFIAREVLAYREAESKQKPVGFGIMLVNGGVIQTHEVYITEQSAINAIDNILSAKPRAHETFIPVPLYTSPVLSEPVSDDSNPVAEIVSKHGDPEAFGERELHVIADIRKMPYGTKLYASPVLGQTPEQYIIPKTPGLYAIQYCNNWDGEHDTYYLFARLDTKGSWISEETGNELLQYEGDEILKAWLLEAK